MNNSVKMHFYLKKGVKEEEYRVKPEYYEYYKVLYMKPSAPSVIDYWVQTLNYAKQKDKIKTANFPCDKTFDRLLKKEDSTEEIKRARQYHEKVIAKDFQSLIFRHHPLLHRHRTGYY